MTPGRCLLVTSVFPPVLGGSATVYENLARFGDGRVCVLAPEVNYLTGEPLPDVAAFDAGFPAPVFRLPHVRTMMGARGRHGLAELAEDLFLRVRLVLTIWWLTRVHGIGTLVIGELLANGWLAGIARNWLGLFTVIYVHGEEITMTGGYDANGDRRRRALREADRIITVSDFSQSALTSLMGGDAAKITLIPNGVDVSRFTPRPPDPGLRARYGLTGRVLLSVCRLTARKGVDQVIECLPSLRRIYPDLMYLVVGDGEDRAALQRRAAELDLGDAVMFAGAVDRALLAEHYALADIFIMPNRTLANGDTEGFGLVFMEASACGVPVIGGRAGGTAEAVRDGVTGLLVDGTSRDDISAAIRQLLDNPAQRAAMGRAGVAFAAENGWRSRAARFLAVCTPDRG